MKKVLGILAVAIVLVAAFPMTATAGNVHPGCGGIFFRPCPATMPPVVTGGNSNGTRSGGSLLDRLRHLDRPRHRLRLAHASPELPAPGRHPLSRTTSSLREPPDASRAVSLWGLEDRGLLSVIWSRPPGRTALTPHISPPTQ